MKRLLLILSLFYGSIYAQGDLPHEALEEVQRRGNHVEIIDGFQQRDEIGEVMAPPADDSHKWFITVITSPSCSACEKLKYDFANSKDLRAWVNTENHEKSFTHYNVYRYNDGTQSWRWSNIRLKAFPTILIQPPLNKRYGEPKTVVAQFSGYDGDAKKLSERIRSSMIRYVDSLSKKVSMLALYSNVGFAQTMINPSDSVGQRRPSPDFLPPDVVPNIPPELDQVPVLPHFPNPLDGNPVIDGFKQIFSGFFSVFTGTTGSNIVQGLLLFVIVILLIMMFMKSAKDKKDDEKPQS